MWQSQTRCRVFVCLFMFCGLLCLCVCLCLVSVSVSVSASVSVAHLERSGPRRACAIGATRAAAPRRLLLAGSQETAHYSRECYCTPSAFTGTHAHKPAHRHDSTATPQDPRHDNRHRHTNKCAQDAGYTHTNAHTHTPTHKDTRTWPYYLTNSARHSASPAAWLRSTMRCSAFQCCSFASSHHATSARTSLPSRWRRLSSIRNKRRRKSAKDDRHDRVAERGGVPSSLCVNCGFVWRYN